MNSQPIGIIDSGVGGLSVWKEVVSLLPKESILYLADSANIPYGTKSPEEIAVLAKALVDFLISHDIKLLIIACNTMTVTCLDMLRQQYPALPIIGVVPVVKTASAVSKNKKIGILSTIATAQSAYQRELIEKFTQGFDVTNRGTDQLVPLVERGEVAGEAVMSVLKEELLPFQEAHVDALVLGCTHFPFLEEQMRQILGSHVAILDSDAAVARQTKRVLERNIMVSDTKSPSYSFYTTGDAKKFEKIAKKLVGKEYRDKIGEVVRCMI